MDSNTFFAILSLLTVAVPVGLTVLRDPRQAARVVVNFVVGVFVGLVLFGLALAALAIFAFVALTKGFGAAVVTVIGVGFVLWLFSPEPANPTSSSETVP